MKSRSILLFGDVHGRFDHALHEALARRPAGVVFLGDIEPTRSMQEILAPLKEEGIQTWWIRGNHDTEHVTTWLHLVTALNENLDQRVVELRGIRLAGFGGVFRKTVWSPDLQQFDGKTASFKSFKEFATQRILATPGPARFKEQGITAEQAIAALDDPLFHANVLFGSEILHLSSIFPEDFEQMANLQADVLITHEAPSCHPYGHIGIDHLARAMGAKLVIHGHHHDSLDYSAEQKRMGFACVGVGFRGIAELDLDSLEVRVVRQGDYDVERAGRMRSSLTDTDDEL
ncbi:metallophosphoesterase [Methyloversatilis sp. XJ19-49]|uniref:metallophosphoesterase family protein n=1 Tax=Methyloversatilis sp. XJ19-49 TaxID=2963429 RepID=UPI00211CD4AD|nr:metallophosphoesterase [Methyloversatilis sp. XJ19-49]MCQ9377781.1 metallophosphoesterase [Methyloversatilis sp. XJ19-49]